MRNYANTALYQSLDSLRKELRQLEQENDRKDARIIFRRIRKAVESAQSQIVQAGCLSRGSRRVRLLEQARGQIHKAHFLLRLAGEYGYVKRSEQTSLSTALVTSAERVANKKSTSHRKRR